MLLREEYHANLTVTQINFFVVNCTIMYIIVLFLLNVMFNY